MNYALNLAEDGRVLSVTYPQYAPDDAPLVDSLPDGNVADYRYIDGEFVYDPLPEEPKAVVISPRNVTAGEYITVSGIMYKATANIPNGEPIITGQNAVETTVEEQLYELTKGE